MSLLTRGNVYVDLLASVYERMELNRPLYLLLEKEPLRPDEVPARGRPQEQVRLLQARPLACRSRTVAEAWGSVAEETREPLVQAEGAPSAPSARGRSVRDSRGVREARDGPRRALEAGALSRGSRRRWLTRRLEP